MYSADAQNASSATLTLLDANSHSPLAGANCILTCIQNKKETKVNYSTDSEGVSEFEVSGTCALEIRFLGYLSQSFNINSGSETTIYLEPDQAKLDEVVITAQYGTSSVSESTYDVQVINREQIDQRAAGNLRDILKTELNMSIEEDGVFGSGINIQGVDGANVKIMVDGVPVIGRLNNQIDLGQISLNNAERIEIIEGPVSTIYGTNALAGVINVITKSDQENQLNGYVNGHYESVGRYNLDGRLGYKKKKHYLQLQGGRNFFNGFSDPDTARDQQWNPKEQYFGGLLYKTTLGKNTDIRLNTDYFHEHILNRFNRTDQNSIFAFDDRYRSFRHKHVLNLQSRFKEGKSIDFLASFSGYKRTKTTYLKNLVTLEQERFEDESAHDTTRIQSYTSRGTYAIDNPEYKINFQAGYDLTVEKFRGKRIIEGDQAFADLAFFSSFRYEPVDRVYIQPGVRIGHNTQYRMPITPSLLIKYRSQNDFTFRASYARGFRAPGVKELHLFFVDVNHNIQGNDSLKAERSHNLQSSFQLKRAFKEHQIKNAAGFFFNHITDRINLALIDPASSFYTYVNISEFTSTGITYEFDYSFRYLEIKNGLAATWIRNSLSEYFNETDFYPTYQFTSDLTYRVPKWGLKFNVINKFTGNSRGLESNPETGELTESEISGYNQLDLSISKQFWGDRLRFTAGVKNLFDVTNVTTSGSMGGVHSNYSSDIPVSMGRNYFANLKLYLSKK